MAILRGQDGPNIPMMACIPTNDSTVFTCAARIVRCFFDHVKTIATNDCLLEVLPKSTKSSETPHM